MTITQGKREREREREHKNVYTFTYTQTSTHKKPHHHHKLVLTVLTNLCNDCVHSEQGQIQDERVGSIFTQNPGSGIVYFAGVSVDVIFPGTMLKIIHTMCSSYFLLMLFCFNTCVLHNRWGCL